MTNELWFWAVIVVAVLIAVELMIPVVVEIFHSAIKHIRDAIRGGQGNGRRS